ncbi:DUF6916 family protein [uncultured Enterovirga sp.]|uniref:DUF6916 family protein n=1 Tax=uncultured Enterovirga sp. TaxID=2026352 RepID=UPI0035CA7A59
MTTFDLAKATFESFAPRKDDVFDLQGSSGNLALRLADVQRLGPTPRAGGAFSLVFLGDPGPFLPQATYPLSHPELGVMEMFIVPLGPQGDGNAYEAVFA